MAARRLRRIAPDSPPQARTRRLAAAALLAALWWGAAAPAAAQQVRMLVQSSPLAGFSHHEGRALWPGLSRGDTLALVREVDNPHDANAVAVLWRGHKLGYVPRTQNTALAWAMDRGETISARISALRKARNPRKRIEFEVFVE